jgi:hypothetical protein
MKARWMFAIAVFVLALAPRPAFAQSSGSFNFSADTTECTDIAGLLGGGTTITSIHTTMKVSSSTGVALVVRPSAVTGLLTNVSLASKLGSALSTGSAQASIRFMVTVTPLSGQPAPHVTPSGPVTYDDRFTQVSTNVFGLLSTCTDAVPCTFDFNQTTLSAHSFDFVVTGLRAGSYGIAVSWTPSTNFTAPSRALACVGPVVVTTEQVKIFNQSTGISF